LKENLRKFKLIDTVLNAYSISMVNSQLGCSMVQYVQARKAQEPFGRRIRVLWIQRSIMR